MPVVFVATIAALCRLLPARTVVAEAPSQVPFFLTAFKDGRERIWAYEGEGHWRHCFPTPQGRKTEEIDFFVAGNYRSDQYRFDVVRHGAIFSGASAEPGSPTRRKEEASLKETKQIWKSNGVTVWTSENGAIRNVTIVKPEHVSSLYKPFDVRAIGLASPGDLTNFTRFESMWRRYFWQGAIRHHSERRPFYEVAFQSEVRCARGTAPLAVWMKLDGSKDFVPVTVAVYIGRSFEDVNGMEQVRAHPNLAIKTTWTSVGGCWLPETCLILRNRATLEEETYEYAFSWQRINETIEESLFKTSGLGLKNNGASVIDARQDKPVLVEIIDAGRPVDAERLARPTRRRWFLGLAAVGILLLAAAAVILMRQPSRTRPRR